MQVILMTKWLQLKAMFLAGALLVCFLTSGYAAVEQDGGVAAESVGEKTLVYVDGTAEYMAYDVDGTAYVPLRSFCKSLGIGAVVTQSGAPRTMTVRFDDPNVQGRSCRLQARVGDFYLTVNDRVVYLAKDILYRGGNVLVPMEGLCAAFGMVPRAEEQGWMLATDTMTVCADGSDLAIRRQFFDLFNKGAPDAAALSVDDQKHFISSE